MFSNLGVANRGLEMCFQYHVTEIFLYIKHNICQGYFLLEIENNVKY